jgi:hypothetical protein
MTKSRRERLTPEGIQARPLAFFPRREILPQNSMRLQWLNPGFDRES